MKYYINGQSFVEGTQEEIIAIVQALNASTSGSPTGSASRKHRKHKRHLHEKICDRCGKSCKGLQGLGTHKAKCNKSEVVVSQSPISSPSDR